MLSYTSANSKQEWDTKGKEIGFEREGGELDN